MSRSSDKSSESADSFDYDTLRESIESSDRERAFALINPAPVKSFVVFASDRYDRMAWVDAIRAQQQELKKRDDLHRKTYLSTGRKASLRHLTMSRSFSQSSMGVETPKTNEFGGEGGGGVRTPLTPAGSFLDINFDNAAAEKKILFVPNTKACMLCKESFTWMRRPHHCRSCGKCVCHSCSPTKLEIRPGEGQERVCVSCYIVMVK